MKPHLNPDEFADRVIAAEPGAHSHSAQCTECRDELDRFNAAALEFRRALRASAERPPFFWAAQRTAIRARLDARSNSHGLRWALASTVALAALALAMLFPTMPQPVRDQRQAVVLDQDELLMRQVGESILSDVADPLEPTSLIAEDLGKALQQSQKESKNQ